MSKTRLEAFSDGVIAIIITIMVLELTTPHTDHVPTLIDLLPLWPHFLSYILSFVLVGIYWNNHHHLLHSCKRVGGPALWANLVLLFWLSLVPFGSRWMGESNVAPWPVAIYGFIQLMCGLSFYMLGRVLIRLNGSDSTLATAVGSDRKGQLSLALYAIATPLALVSPWIAVALYVVVAVMWLIPDPRIERAIAD